MTNCIPSELFNMIPFDYSGDELNAVSVSPLVQEIVYRFPNVKDVTIEREIWHGICDFARRTGTLLEKSTTSGTSMTISPTFGKFVNAVGGSGILSITSSGVVAFKNGGSNYVVYSVDPSYVIKPGTTLSASHVIPKWYLNKYQDVLVNAALVSLFTIAADEASARMAATTYGNDVNRCSVGFITSGMRKRIEVGYEDLFQSTRYRIQEKQDGK